MVAVTFLETGGDLRRPAQRALVEEWLAREHGRVVRICPHCGGSDHGRPRIGALHVSLAYAAGLVTVAVADVAVGVDAEALGPAPALADRLAWTRTEAVLKLTGEGIRRDPASVSADEAWTTSLAAPPGYVASLAAYAPVNVRCWTETVAGPGPRATDTARP
jgi:4'-phosphopantetheinyl transferase